MALKGKSNLEKDGSNNAVSQLFNFSQVMRNVYQFCQYIESSNINCFRAAKKFMYMILKKFLIVILFGFIPQLLIKIMKHFRQLPNHQVPGSIPAWVWDFITSS